MEPEKHFEFF